MSFKIKVCHVGLFSRIIVISLCIFKLLRSSVEINVFPYAKHQDSSMMIVRLAAYSIRFGLYLRLPLCIYDFLVCYVLGLTFNIVEQGKIEQ